MTLLTICQNVADQIGLPRPTSVYGSSDQTARSLLAFANLSGKELVKVKGKFGGGWTILQREHTFTTTASEPEYALPSDFRSFIDGTVWDRENYLTMRGPLSPQEWQVVKSGLIQTSQFERNWRVKRSTSSVANKFVVDPTPDTSNQTLVFEYNSDSWVIKASDSTVTTAYTADGDTTVFDESLLEMAVKWRFKASKGLAYAIDLAEYETARDRAIASDGGGAILMLSRHDPGLPQGNVPDTGFGS